MSGYPIVLRGAPLRALVVGGGAVATRKVAALLDVDAAVTVVALAFTPALLAHSAAGRIRAVRREFETADLDGATIAFAATDDRHVNGTVARTAREVGVLVNIADDPDASDFLTPAVHRAGALTIAVSAGRLPGAAARVRDAIADRFDARYAAALARLTTRRSALLEAGDRPGWRTVADAVLADDFCASVEDGRFDARMDAWR